jgi:hypothetical protein
MIFLPASCPSSSSLARETTWPGVDLLHGLRDERALLIVLVQLPQQEVRVHRDAVATDARAGLDGQEAVWLGRRRAGDFHRVEIQDPAGVRELVGEGQHNGALDILIQLGRLGGFWPS